jgi:predicted Zn finger-like uncharacterized protein
MSIRVQCGACGAKYNVADSMAGKRVRCKHCGAVLAVAAAGGGGGGGGAPAERRPAAAEAPPVNEPDFSAVPDEEDAQPSDIPTPFQRRPAPPAPRRPSVLPPESRMPGEGEEAGEGEGEESSEQDVMEAPPVTVANAPFRFRGSRQLDSSLAFVIAIIGVTWMIAQTLLADTPNGKGWINYLRIGLYLGAYAIIVYPLTLLGVSVAGGKVHFGFPRQHKWKVFAVFSLPFMLGIILSLNGGLLAFIGGALVGLLGALGTFWFLYRLRPTQTGTALAYVGGFFGAGAAIAVLLGVGINMALLASFKASKTANDYNISPLGPAFAWEAAPQPLAAKKQRTPTQVTGEQPTETADSSASQPGTATTTDAATKPTASQPVVANANATQPDTTTAPDAGSPTTRMVATNVQPPTTTVTSEGTQPTTAAATTQRIATTVAAASPLVASVSTDLPTGAFEHVTFPPGAGPGSMLILRARGPIADQLEVWNTQPLAKTATLAPQHPKDARPEYWLGPKGQTVVRLVDFPHKMIEVRSSATDQVIKGIDLDVANNGDPEIAGVAAGNQLIVLWNHGGEYGIEIFELASGTRTRALLPKDMTGFQKGKGNLVMSPDGRYLALAVKTASGPAVQLTDVTAPPRAPARQYPVLALGAGKPPAFSGMAFSPDSQRFGVFYEEAGSWLIVTFKPPDVRQQSQQTLFSDRPAGAGEYPCGGAFDWMPDGVAWLLYGHAVVEGSHVLGDLAIPNLRGHHLIDKDAMLVVVPSANEPEKLGLELVKLDAAKLAGMETTKPPGGAKVRP